MQKKCLQKNQQKSIKNPENPSKNPEKPKNPNFKKWVFANPVYHYNGIRYIPLYYYNDKV